MLRPDSSTESPDDFFTQRARAAGLAAAHEVIDKFLRTRAEPRTWFSLQQAAEYLAVAEQTLSRFVKEGTAPKSVKISAGRRFHRDDLDAWVRAGGVFAIPTGRQS